MKRKLTAGQTSVSLPIFIQNTSSATGGGLSGLTSGTSGLVAEYRRRGQSAWTAITLTSKTLGTWTSGGIVADGALGGAYELDLPDAVCASGARWVAVRLYGAANMLPCLIEIELDVIDYSTAWLTTLGATAPSDWINANSVASDAVNKISDGILTRNVSNVESTAGEHTLATVVLSTLEWEISGSDLVIKRTDGSTVHYTKTLSSATGTGDVITGLN